MVSDNVSLKAEYRYSDFGAETYNYGFVSSDTSFTTHTATVGVNFHF
jgi:opacity protein-like surface antigen